MRTQYATCLAIAILLKGLFALQVAPASAVELKEGAQNVGILLFNDLFITEFVAPFDIYKHVGNKMNVFTVSQTHDPIRTYEGVTLQADFTLRVCGGAAFRKDVGVERRFRDARANTVMAPTTDQLYDFIGKVLCGLPVF